MFRRLLASIIAVGFLGGIGSVVGTPNVAHAAGCSTWLSEDQRVAYGRCTSDPPPSPTPTGVYRVCATDGAYTRCGGWAYWNNTSVTPRFSGYISSVWLQHASG